MMSHIVIPSINCQDKDFACVVSRVRQTEQLFGASAGWWKRLFGSASVGSRNRWVHLDVADGVFAYHKSWREANLWPQIQADARLEVHLMVEDPIAESNAWLHAGAERLVVHAETVHPHMLPVLAELAERKGAEVMLASNPETELREIEKMLPHVHSFQVLSVTPGLAGQKFLPRALDKIRALRQMYPNATIEVDGGINEKTGKQALEAGASVLVSASYIFGADNPQAAYRKLANL